MEEFIKSGLTMNQIEYVLQLFDPSMDDCLYVYDLKHDYYRISSHATERFLMDTDHFYHAEQKHETFVYYKDIPFLKEEFNRIKSGTIIFHNLHYRWLDREGRPVWINCRGKVLKDSGGTPAFLIGCINEIGQRQKADNMTGLLGESSLEIFVNQYEGLIPDGFFLRIGVDDFKDINGGYGAEYGDYLLKWLAESISKRVEPGQKVYRIFSDEFMIVDVNHREMESAVRFYKDMRRAVDAFVESNGYQAVFTISGGILDTKKIKGDYDTLMKLSEFALTEAKEAGKNRCCIFDEAKYQSFLQKKELTAQLHHAVNHDFEGFEVYFQPIVDAGNYELRGAESLMRFSLPDGERISPAEFIPILEETGLIIPAGKWLMRRALCMCKKWQEYIPDFKINVNLSYIQVIKSQVLKEIMGAIEEYDLAPESVGIELTESGYLDSNPHFKKLWNGLRKNGVQIILDDFGTGYSNLHCLGDLEPDYIKIDRSFTMKALNREYEHNLMTQIIEMSHSLELAICVEGIETDQELSEMCKLGPDYIQGYYFGKPEGEGAFEQKFIHSDAVCGTRAESGQSAF